MTLSLPFLTLYRALRVDDPRLCSLTHSSSPPPRSTGGVQLFMTPLRMSNILNDADINTIFSNTQLLLGVNMYVRRAVTTMTNRGRAFARDN